MEEGFDSEKYLEFISKEIKLRAKGFKRFYLEVGGKLIFDGHASRVLPGYNPKNKLHLLSSFRNLGIIYCINANDLESKKKLTKKKVNYVSQIKKELEEFSSKGFHLETVVITRFKEGKKYKKVKKFLKYLKKKKIDSKVFREWDNYSEETKFALESFKDNGYIYLKKRLIVLTGPAGNSGKMAVALSQLYHEIKNGKKVKYAKLETFPVWDLPLKHPINLAYEAATADLGDKNMLDKLHLKAHKIKATSYNRDLNNFKILRRVTSKRNPFGYKSTTDMGISGIKLSITNEKICEASALKEIINRYEWYKEEVKKGREDRKTIERMRQIARKAE